MVAAALIHRIAVNDPSLTECDLNCARIYDVSVLANGLKTNRFLSKLDLSQNFFGPTEAIVLAGALKVNTALTELNVRHCLLTDIKPLAEVLESSRSLSKLNLNNNEFGAAGGLALARALKVNVVLTELYLDRCGLKDIKELGESLANNRSLSKLDLSRNRFGNAGGVALAGALKINTVLTELNLEDCGLTDIKELAESLASNRFLSKLSLTRNQFGPAGGVALAGALRVNVALTEIVLGGCGLKGCGLTEIKEFAESLKTNRDLSKLNLGCNAFGPAGGMALACMIKVNTALTDLDLFNCGLRDIKELAESLMSNRSLSKLSLSENRLGNMGGVVLTRVLKVNPVLTDLNLFSCALTDIKELTESLMTNRFLSKLNLGGNAFGNTGGVALAGALKVNTALTELGLNSCDLTDIKELAAALKTNRFLVKLDLYWNKFGTAGGEALAATLKVNTVLGRLALVGCNLTDIKELAESLKSNRTLSTLNLSCNDFGPAGGVALAGSLKVNAVLTDVNLSRCGLTDIKELAESLKSNRTLSKLQVDSNEFGSSGGEALTVTLGVNSTLINLNITACKIDRKFEVLIQEQIAINRSLKGQKPQVNPTTKGLATAVAATEASHLTAGASLDEATINRLKALPGKHDALAKEVQKLTVIDAATLEVLKGHGAQFTRIFERDAVATAIDAERDCIDSDPATQTYYQFFSRLLTGTWMACQTINSGLVQNSKKEKLDYVGQGIDEIGKRIPVISLFTGIFSGIISAWTAREKTIAVQRIALLFPDLESAFKELGQLARQLTLAQRETILRIESQPVKLLDKMKGEAKDLKATLLGEDVKGPLKRKAVEDCEKILTAIRDETPKASPTVADLLTVVLGANFVYKPAPLSNATTAAAAAMPTKATSPTHNTASSTQSPTTEELLERLRKMEEREREREAELKRMKEEVHKIKEKVPDEEEFSGGNMAQAQLSASKVARRTANADPATAAAAHAEVHHRVHNVETYVAVHDARIEEHTDDILALKAEVRQLKTGKKNRRIYQRPQHTK